MTTATTALDIGTLIVRTPEICGGRLRFAHASRTRIDGTRISVMQIAVWHKLGMSAAEIVAEIPHLTLSQVYAALAYYYSNQEAIEAEIAEAKAECDSLEEEPTPRGIRNHKAFSNSYAPEDEGLYDDY